MDLYSRLDTWSRKHLMLPSEQCCGSVTIWYGSGSDPRIRASDQWIRIWILLFSSLAFRTPSDNYFFCLLVFEGTFTSPFTDKSHKKVTKRNQGFTYYFCLMLEGSGFGAGSVPRINGSGSGSRRPKNIRIRNTSEFLTIYWSIEGTSYEC